MEQEVIKALNLANHLVESIKIKPEQALEVVSKTTNIHLSYKRKKFFYHQFIAHDEKTIVIQILVNEWFKAERIKPELFLQELNRTLPLYEFAYSHSDQKIYITKIKIQ